MRVAPGKPFGRTHGVFVREKQIFSGDRNHEPASLWHLYRGNVCIAAPASGTELVCIPPLLLFALIFL